MKKIKSKYIEYLLAPANAITETTVETVDGFICNLRFQSTWNNEYDRYEEQLDDVCQRYYHCPFRAIKSIWFDRLGMLSEYWHLVKMEKIDGARTT